MTDAGFTEIEGIRCYAPHVALASDDYPTSGFDVTADVEARSFWCRTRNRVLAQVFKRFTDHTRSLDVLEVGCGIGGVIGSLRQFPNLKLTGSEIYIHGLRYARARLPDVEFIQMDATKIPFRNAFDVVGAFDVLEHIPDDELAMAQVALAVRPGGLFVVTVPQYPWLWSRLDELVHHKRRYTRQELTDKLARAGFEVTYVTSFISLLLPAMVLARVADPIRRKGSDAGEFADRVSPPALLNTMCDWLMRVDETILKLGFTIPVGGSLLAVARRPTTTP